MRARQWMAMVVLGAACAAPVQAAEQQDPFAQVEAVLNPRVLLQGVLQEQDVALLFAHLRAVLMASAEGREAPSPEALTQRAEAIAGELKLRGTVAGLLLLTAFEAAAKQALRDALANPAEAR